MKVVNPIYLLAGVLAIGLAVGHELWGLTHLLNLLPPGYVSEIKCSISVIWHQQAAALLVIGSYLCLFSSKPQPSRTALRLILTLLGIQYLVALSIILLVTPSLFIATFPQLLIFSVLILVLYLGQR